MATCLKHCLQGGSGGSVLSDDVPSYEADVSSTNAGAQVAMFTLLGVTMLLLICAMVCMCVCVKKKKRNRPSWWPVVCFPALLLYRFLLSFLFAGAVLSPTGPPPALSMSRLVVRVWTTTTWTSGRWFDAVTPPLCPTPRLLRFCKPSDGVSKSCCTSQVVEGEVSSCDCSCHDMECALSCRE